MQVALPQPSAALGVHVFYIATPLVPWPQSGRMVLSVITHHRSYLSLPTEEICLVPHWVTQEVELKVLFLDSVFRRVSMLLTAGGEGKLYKLDPIFGGGYEMSF